MRPPSPLIVCEDSCSWLACVKRRVRLSCCSCDELSYRLRLTVPGWSISSIGRGVSKGANMLWTGARIDPGWRGQRLSPCRLSMERQRSQGLLRHPRVFVTYANGLLRPLEHASRAGSTTGTSRPSGLVWWGDRRRWIVSCCNSGRAFPGGVPHQNRQKNALTSGGVHDESQMQQELSNYTQKMWRWTTQLEGS